jgi:predicted kinase
MNHLRFPAHIGTVAAAVESVRAGLDRSCLCDTAGMGGRVVLLCGRSFSGKSTVGRGLGAALGGTVVSLDAINQERGLDGGQGIPIAEWARTNEIARERVAAELSEGRTVIIDDTSSPRFLRDGWRRLSACLGAALVLVFIDASLDTIAQRLAANRFSTERGDVIDSVMTEHLNAFEPPAGDESALRFAAENLSIAKVVAAVAAALSAAD